MGEREEDGGGSFHFETEKESSDTESSFDRIDRLMAPLRRLLGMGSPRGSFLLKERITSLPWSYVSEGGGRDLVKEGKKNGTFSFDCQKAHDQHMGK